MRRGGPALLLRACCCLVIAALTAGQATADNYDSIIRELRRAVTAQPDGRHLILLRALRELRDPTLEPLFSQIANTSSDQLIRVHGILGLAELDADQRVDTWLISRLGTEKGRFLAIRHSLQLELLDVEGMQEMLAWDDLQDAPRVLMLAELFKRGVAPNQEVLVQLAGHTDLSVAGLASAMLAQIDRPEAFEAIRSRVKSLTRSKRLQARIWLFEDIARYRFDRLADWIKETLAQGDVDSSLALAGVAAVLQINPQEGVRLWHEHLGEDPRYGKSVRYGRLLLELADEVDIPASAYQKLRDGEDLTERMADLGVAIANGQRRQEAMIALVDADHWPTARRAIELAEPLDAADRVELYQHVIRRAGEDVRRRNERMELAIRVVPMLFELSPEAVFDLLDEIEDDSPLQEGMLIGLLNSRDSRTQEAARRIPRRGFNRADSLCMTLIARHAESLEPEELDAVGMIATGGGRISPAHQIQAAWLYLRHVGRTEQAIASLFGGS